jgi:hypothetical protein
MHIFQYAPTPASLRAAQLIGDLDRVALALWAEYDRRDRRALRDAAIYLDKARSALTPLAEEAAKVVSMEDQP